LGRQFWVTKKEVKANKYDLSASRYREIEPEKVYYEQPQVTMERLLLLNETTNTEINDLMGLIG
jgi:type I restriction enzyme M protein